MPVYRFEKDVESPSNYGIQRKDDYPTGDTEVEQRLGSRNFAGRRCRIPSHNQTVDQG